MRSSLPSPSESNVLSTHTWPWTQSARVAENTFCAKPLTNVGTAGAGSGAGAAASPTAFSVIFGGIGAADAALAPPTAAKAVAVVAVAKSLILKPLLPSRACVPAVTAYGGPQAPDRQRSGAPGALRCL